MEIECSDDDKISGPGPGLDNLDTIVAGPDLTAIESQEEFKKEHVGDNMSNSTPNPWEVVHHVQDFSFYCCPECSFKSKAVNPFQDHAMEHHPMVSCTDMFKLFKPEIQAFQAFWALIIFILS